MKNNNVSTSLNVSSTDKASPLTPQDRAAIASKQLAGLIDDCSTWEQNDLTSRSQLYQHLQACAITLEKTQVENDGSEAWLEADALHKAISEAVTNTTAPKIKISSTSYNQMRNALIYLAFPLSRGSDGCSRDMRYRYRKALIACHANKHVEDAATWIESEGGINVIARNFETNGTRKVPPDMPDEVDAEDFTYQTWAHAEGDDIFKQFLETADEGQPVVLIGTREGDKVVVHVGTHDKRALTVAVKAAANETIARKDGDKEAA